MIKYYCDHCGKEITGLRYDVESTLVNGADLSYNGVLCYDCNEYIGQFLTRVERLEEETEHE